MDPQMLPGYTLLPFTHDSGKYAHGFLWSHSIPGNPGAPGNPDGPYGPGIIQGKVIPVNGNR